MTSQDKITKTSKQPTAEALRLEFGATSENYLKVINVLNALKKEVEGDPTVDENFNHWRDAFEVVYGYEPRDDLFVAHTYLATLVKLVLYFILNTPSKSRSEIAKAMSGEYFRELGIVNFAEDDFSTWVLNPRICNRSVEMFYELSQRLSKYDFSRVEEDLFKELYEEIVGRSDRHATGEYYTPEWLTQLILSEVMRLWQKEHEGLPRILDPACGSGTFLCNSIKLFKSLTPKIPLERILQNIVGIDINPLASMISKTNYIIALGDLVQKGVSIRLPIYTADALKLGAERLGQFDILVGNPPWIVMRSIKKISYQKDLKQQFLEYGLLRKDEVHLFTQIEMATLFFCKSADLYLKNGGIIGFVMPRSVIAGTIQHVGFRLFKFPKLKLVKILDMEEVEPLFNMPSCVLIGIKGRITKYPVLAEKYSAQLPRKNTSLTEAQRFFSIATYDYSPPEFPSQRSDYFDKFKVGASIFPRSLYFIEILSREGDTVDVRTSREILEIVKHPWKVELSGKIETKFIYATVLAWEIVPFNYLMARPIVLPVAPLSNGYKLYEPADLENAGYRGVSAWFSQAQKIWQERSTERSKMRFPKLSDRLNYNGLMTSQDPSKRYAVLYNATGTNLASCVVDKFSLRGSELLSSVQPNGFVADVKCWFYETNDRAEAFYLMTVLNSDVVNRLIKPLQPRGLWGARAIHRRPLMFHIPIFDTENEVHLELAEIGEQCQEIVAEVPRKNGFRNHVRRILDRQIVRVDELVRRVLRGH